MKLSLECTPVFEKNWNSNKRIVINRGGTRSSKTYSLAQIFVLWLISGKIGDKVITSGVASIVRKTSPALTATAMRDFEEILHNNDLYKLIQHNKTERTYSFKNRMVEFFSVDDQQKVRGRKRNILWCNEANELSYKEDFYQLNLRTTDKIFLDFNPDDENIWINTELEQKRLFDKGDVDVIVSSYKDNTFLSPDTINEIEYLEETDSEFWQIFGLGEYGKIRGLIFNNWEIIPEVPQGAKRLGGGKDFGFTNDPTALIEVYQQDGYLILNELIYQRGLTNDDIYQKCIELGITRDFEIIADSAEPKSIEELHRLGLNVKAALKGADSIKSSIDILKRYKIKVTASSVNLIKELRSYKWAEDKNGNSLNVPVDFNNHAIDAVRYFALNKLSHNQVKYVVI